jgi:hypothetical protein
MAADEYEKLIAICAEREAPVLLGTSGEARKSAVGSASSDGRPLMLKPYLEEALSLCGAEAPPMSLEALIELLSPLLGSIRFIALGRGCALPLKGGEPARQGLRRRDREPSMRG